MGLWVLSGLILGTIGCIYTPYSQSTYAAGFLSWNTTLSRSRLIVCVQRNIWTLTSLYNVKGHGHDVRVQMFLCIHIINLEFNGVVVKLRRVQCFWPRLPNLRTHISIRKHRDRGPLTLYMRMTIYQKWLFKGVAKFNSRSLTRLILWNVPHWIH